MRLERIHLLFFIVVQIPTEGSSFILWAVPRHKRLSILGNSINQLEPSRVVKSTPQSRLTTIPSDPNPSPSARIASAVYETTESPRETNTMPMLLIPVQTMPRPTQILPAEIRVVETTLELDSSSEVETETQTTEVTPTEGGFINTLESPQMTSTSTNTNAVSTPLPPSALINHEFSPVLFDDDAIETNYKTNDAPTPVDLEGLRDNGVYGNGNNDGEDALYNGNLPRPRSVHSMNDNDNDNDNEGDGEYDLTQTNL